MLFLFASILVQIVCAVHCVRGGRNSMWLMVIIFLSLPGCLAYFIFEIMPGLSGRREVRAVKRAAVKAMDPEREIRLAREAVDIADTAANRIALADALAAHGPLARRHPALRHRRGQGAGRRPADPLQARLACFEAGKSDARPRIARNAAALGLPERE